VEEEDGVVLTHNDYMTVGKGTGEEERVYSKQQQWRLGGEANTFELTLSKQLRAH
jgi:hypothetical protein